jgi:hypothetical protein
MGLAKAPLTNTLAAATNGPAALRDIKPPVEIPSGWEWLWWVLGGLAIGAALTIAWRYYRKRAKTEPVMPSVPPHIRAMQALEHALSSIGDARAFCIAVSDAVRWYLEERFDFRAPERTTEEFLREIQGTNLLTETQKTTLGDFLQRCDLVKFARYEPAEPELRDLHAAAVRLVQETAPAFAAEHAPVEAAR